MLVRVWFHNSYGENESYGGMFNGLIANKLWLLGKYLVPSRGEVYFIFRGSDFVLYVPSLF